MMRLLGFCPRNIENDSDNESDKNQYYDITIYGENECLPKSRVTFSEYNKVYIIPNKDTYSDDKFSLWWSQSEINNAHNSSYKEVQKLIRLYPNLHFKKARKVLYQSNMYFELNNT